MIHRVYGRKLNRSTKQRKALLKSLANSVILYEKIKTTEAKAKAVKPFVEKLVTISKEDTIPARRQLIAKLGLKNSVEKLLEVVGPVFKERPGGYLRITKLPARSGDAAKMVVLEFVEEVSKPTKVKEKKPVNSEKALSKSESKAPKKKEVKVETSAKAKTSARKKVKDEKASKKK